MTRQAPRDTGVWGRDLLLPDGEFESGPAGWLSRDSVPDAEEAISVAAEELSVARERIQLRPVLLREESEVEAKINGHEFPYWVECTTRARSYERFWRVETDA